MSENVVAASHIGYDDAGDITTTEGMPFDADSYSRMKYGSQIATQQLGVVVGERILEEAPQIKESPDPIVALSIYKTVPSGAVGLTSAAVTRINESRFERGLSEVRPVHVKMAKVLGLDYSTLDTPGRQKYIAGTGYQLRPPENVAGSHTILIDDIRVTGSAEQLGRDLLKGKGHKSLTLGYVAIMDPESARRDPSIEKRINVAAIKDLDDIASLIDSGGLTITLRTMKRVMEEPDHDKLRSFLQRIPEQTLFELYAGALSSGRDYIEYYRPGFDVVQKAVLEKRMARTTLTS